MSAHPKPAEMTLARLSPATIAAGHGTYYMLGVQDERARVATGQRCRSGGAGGVPGGMRAGGRMSASTSAAALIAATVALQEALQEALGELAQRALCSDDPAAVSEAAALVARMREMLPAPPR